MEFTESESESENIADLEIPYRQEPTRLHDKHVGTHLSVPGIQSYIVLAQFTAPHIQLIEPLPGLLSGPERQ